MKLAWNVIALVLILAGSIFALQGLNILLGSFMSGRGEWLVIGGVMVVVGMGLLLATNWRRSQPR